jgi:hypothetical protein
MPECGDRPMTMDETNKEEPKERKQAFAYSGKLNMLLFAVCVFEYGFIKFVWFNPSQTIDLFMKICLQILVLGPVYAGLSARTEMGKKMKAGEISPAYASDLGTWLVLQLAFVYITFMLLMLFVRH